jgi:hypothetical protein
MLLQQTAYTNMILLMDPSKQAYASVQLMLLRSPRAASRSSHQEQFTSEVTLQLVDRGADQQGFLTPMNPDIIVLCGDPIDLVRGKPQDSIA